MALKKFSDRLFYYLHETTTDRPMLAYYKRKGEKYILAIDAGNSASHVEDFYASLEVEQFLKPDYTAITHWHWDHTFGMHQIHGVSIAHKRTNGFLRREKNRLKEESYSSHFLKSDDQCLAKEYEDCDIIEVHFNATFI
ncbi:MBL fold metallo-hydrolase [endosymbiont 'TC1' of Trimyema compressum]|uniref:MBL fold metallo-hydrolase n=1 Tax=endosymbiont 'TC1' of Trimyema compressum TaxID=243899 RepID=UPI0013922261|nr:MBL fold metallo-hydrolase [endosymbiont 'TC1' of Trimyema compressum]